MTSHVEVVGGRRRWTVDQKLVILRDAFGPGGSVRDVCKQHNIGSGQIYTWRRQAMSGELTSTTLAELRLERWAVCIRIAGIGWAALGIAGQ